MEPRVYINGRYLTQEITGVQRYGHELISAIDRAHRLGDPHFTLLAPVRGLKFEPRLRNIEFRRVGRYEGHLWEQSELPRYSGDGVLFCPGNTAPLVSLLGRRPVVVTVHDLSYRYFPRAYSLAFRAFYGILMPCIVRRARRIITVSQSEAAAMASHYPRINGRLTAIQNGGFGAQVLPEINGIPAKRIGFEYGVYVGSLSRRKNFPSLLQAVIRVVRRSQLGFVFVGGSPFGLRRSAVEIPADVRSKVVFTGSTNSVTDLIAWYKGAQFLAFPSLYEASPFPPIEAMSCGCPVIASRIPSLEERCADAALYCDPANIEEMGDVMLRLANESELRKRMIERGYERAKAFRWEACAAATIDVLRDVARSTSLA